MNNPKILTQSFFLLICSLFAVSKLHAEPCNLGQLKNQLIQYHDSGAYNKELAAVAKQAEQYIEQRARQKTSNKKLALVLDIDETTLSNYAEIRRGDFAYNAKAFHDHIQRANAPAIRPMLSLYQRAKKAGIKIFFITGRSQNEKQATIKNLHAAGYQGWQALYVRQAADAHSRALDFKRRLREKISQQGYLIIASIGDQCSDIQGGYSLKGFKLPNPYYYIP